MKFFKVLACAVALCSALWAEDLRVGTNANFPPFEFVNEEMKITGFEIDLLAEIAKKVGFTYEVVDMGFDGLIPALKSGKIDLIASGMSATEERKKAVDFSKAFFNTENVYLKRADDASINSKDDLKGKIVGAQIGTVQELAAKALEGVETSIVEDPLMEVVALENGKIDAVLLDNFVAYEFLKSHPKLVEFFNEPDGSEGFSFALDKDKNPELLAKINAAIDELIADGTYDKLLEKYDMKK